MVKVPSHVQLGLNSEWFISLYLSYIFLSLFLFLTLLLSFLLISEVTCDTCCPGIYH